MNARPTAPGFTLIELMIVVTIVGILSAFAVPSYHAYVVRARATEGISFAAPFKASLGDYIQANGQVPDTDQDYYSNSGQVVITKVKWSIGRGAMEVWFGPAAGTQLNGTILWLTPTLTAGAVSWTCRGHSGEGGAGWRIDPRYLPSSCR